MPIRQSIARLYEIRREFGAAAAAEKSALLEAIGARRVISATDLKRLHGALCFIRAFPDTCELHGQASAMLETFAARVRTLAARERRKLDDSGIVGTPVFYRFSYEVASWLTRHFPGLSSIDWPDVDDTARLDELLEQILEHSEADYFDSGWVSSEDWLEIASAKHAGNGFDWLMAQLRERRRFARFWTALYNSCDLPLRCDLADLRLSKSGNTYETSTIFERKQSMQRGVTFAKREIVRPITVLELLSEREGTRLLNVAMSALAVRHRETNHFNYANPSEVYLADVGSGIRIAVMGLRPEHRYPLECTMGFLILSNGAPVGYGGSSVMFKQANTGINIFDEYRGAEAAWLWTQVMRVFHHLTGCNRFIANPYQFGGENTEALKSGAFWFYYRLGYRPIVAEIRESAAREFRHVRYKKGYRSTVPLLRKLSSCDMHLTLPGARAVELFEERWIEVCSMLAMRELADIESRSRTGAVKALTARISDDLALRSVSSWSQQERRALERFAPIVALTRPTSWHAADKRALAELIRAKGGACEADYARRLSRHALFFAALKDHCRKAE